MMALYVFGEVIVLRIYLARMTEDFHSVCDVYQHSPRTIICPQQPTRCLLLEFILHPTAVVLFKNILNHYVNIETFF